MPGVTTEPASTPPVRVGMIWAQARGGVIGADGTMPWRLPEDLAHFSRTTTGSPVVMGRRTWESFPPRFRPLPRRTNIVITSHDTFADEGAVRAASLPAALELARADLARRRAEGEGTEGDAGTIWVIGGGRVYREAMDLADLLAVTETDPDVEGRPTAPAVPKDFSLAATGPAEGWHSAASGLRYRMLTYRR